MNLLWIDYAKHTVDRALERSIENDVGERLSLSVHAVHCHAKLTIATAEEAARASRLLQRVQQRRQRFEHIVVGRITGRHHGSDLVSILFLTRRKTLLKTNQKIRLIN